MRMGARTGCPVSPNMATSVPNILFCAGPERALMAAALYFCIRRLYQSERIAVICSETEQGGKVHLNSWRRRS